MKDLNKFKEKISDILVALVINRDFEISNEYLLFRKEDMLYPQYEDSFKIIDEKDFKEIQKKAAELLSTSRDSAHRDVVKHWLNIVNGIVPFGYKLRPSKPSESFG